MKREILNIGWALAATAALSSCDSFLEESPKTFLSPNTTSRRKTRSPPA